MVTIWGVRLALHIGLRHKGEDYRYKLMRQRWVKCGGFAFFAAWLNVFVLQGLFQMVVNASAIHVMWYADASDKIGVWETIGALAWVAGFITEVVADCQLQAHRNDEMKKGTLIKTGLWRVSRHPNYFGELVCWWGIYLVACGGTSGQNGGAWTFYSALFISLLLRYVSGVRLLEKKQAKKAEFRVYMQETAALIPWCYKVIPEGPEKDALLKQAQKDIDDEEAALGTGPRDPLHG